MKLKIIQIGTSSPSFAVKNYNEDIFRGWNAQVAYNIKLEKSNLNVECWCIERKIKSPEILENKGIKFKVFPTEISLRHSMEISMKMIIALNEEIENCKKEKIKLILHIHEYHNWQTYLILSLIETKNIKIICQHHGGKAPFENLKKYKRLTLFLPVIILMQLLEKLSFKKINAFYVLSNNEINYLRKIAPNSEIRFQTMGINNEYFHESNKKELRKKLNLNQNKKYILYIGRVTTNKGIKELLDAMKSIKQENIELVIIGGGSEYKKYFEYSKKNNRDNVIFLGEIYSDKKLDYLSACDCLILPSYTEGAPVVLMEAIARNLPVITTNVGGIPKIIENGREGIIIKPKSSEEIVLAIKEILNWRRKDIRKYAEKYKWNKIIKETIKDYEK